MNKSLLISDSLIGGLCREIDYIRNRYNSISNSLSNCKDKIVKQSLGKELLTLKNRRIELINISNKVCSTTNSSLSKLFLYELCNRPIEIS